MSEERRMNPDCRYVEMEKSLVRLEERIAASERALTISDRHLEAWQKSSNEWRQALNDQRSEYMTKIEARSLVALAISFTTILVLILYHRK